MSVTWSMVRHAGSLCRNSRFTISRSSPGSCSVDISFFSDILMASNRKRSTKSCKISRRVPTVILSLRGISQRFSRKTFPRSFPSSNQLHRRERENEHCPELIEANFFSLHVVSSVQTTRRMYTFYVTMEKRGQVGSEQYTLEWVCQQGLTFPGKFPGIRFHPPPLAYFALEQTRYVCRDRLDVTRGKRVETNKQRRNFER